MTQNRKSPFPDHSDPNQSSSSDSSQDWVCIKCNNLNFSFRKKCNRCKIQLRQDNHQLVYLDYYYYNQYYHYQTQSYPNKTDQVEVGSERESQNEQKSPVKKSCLSLTIIEGKENRGLPSVSPLVKKYNDSQSKKIIDSSKMYWKGQPIEKLFGAQIWNSQFEEVDFNDLQKQLATTDDEQPKQEFIRSVEKMII